MTDDLPPGWENQNSARSYDDAIAELRRRSRDPQYLLIALEAAANKFVPADATGEALRDAALAVIDGCRRGFVRLERVL